MKVKNTGKILQIKDGIITADGLSDLGYNELVIATTSDGTKVEGIALNLEEDKVGIVTIGDSSKLVEGNEVEVTGKLLSINVSDDILGRVISPIGKVLDGKGDIDNKKSQDMPLQIVAAGVIEREDVSRPLQTGIKSIDTMIPVGRGQRELIIGDRQTGKTAIAIDAIINQAQSAKDSGMPLVKCIYVAIGQKVSKVAQIVNKLDQAGAMAYTTVVIAGASESASLQYIAPYAGAAIAEYFAKKGDDTLVVFDDLTKHAWAYREISLLLRRPPGREAYPGDIFYLHSALLERGVQFSEELGRGSITMLPIIETQAGDVSAYIPTNVISITDGQIYLESDLFNAGTRPAVNVGLSVSRVGGSAQTKAMKQVAGQLRLDLAQYRELAAFAQFGSDLDPVTKAKLERGARMVELLKQQQYVPLSTATQIVLIYAGSRGFLDKIPQDEISRWEKAFVKQFAIGNDEIVKELLSGVKIKDKLEDKIKILIEDFNKKYI